MRVKAHQRRIVGLFAVAGGSLALLIWLKLRLVTGVPRTAFADPEANDPRSHHAVHPAVQVDPAAPAPDAPKAAPEPVNTPSP